MTRIVYLCDGESTHDRNFIEVISRVGILKKIDLQSSTNTEVAVEINQSNPDLVIVTPLGPLVELIPDTFQGGVLGISLAFDLNEPKTQKDLSTMEYWLSKFSGIVVDSAYTEDKLRKNFGFKKSILRIIYGIQQTEVPNYPVRVEYLKKMIVTRTWTELHNNSLVLEAFLSVPNNQGYSLSFIESPEIKKFLSENQKKDLKSFGVNFLGTMSNAKLRSVLLEYGLYVSASRSDGSSISLLEAMDSQRICLVSNFPANGEIIIDGYNGFLFQNGNQSDLIDKIMKIQRLSDDEIKRIGENAKKTVERLANWKLHSGALVEFCFKILEAHKIEN